MSEKNSKNPTNKLKLTLIAIIGVLILGVVGAAGFILTQKKETKKVKKEKVSEDVEENSEDHTEEDGESHEKKVQYVPLDVFTVNLSGGKDKFAQITMSVVLTDPTAIDLIKEKTPVLKDRILKLIASKTYEQLMTSEGKDLLSKEILDIIKNNLPKEKKKFVTEVLYTGFIIQ